MVLQYAYLQVRENKHISIGHVAMAGSCQAVWWALDRRGLPRPPNMDYPEELRHFLRREVWAARLADCRKESAWPVFVKPRLAHKEFPGLVFRQFRDIIPTSGSRGDLEVWASRPVGWLSEFRCFVIKGKIIGVHHYRGDPLLFPDASTIRQMVASWTAAPASWTLDVGVLQDGSTARVEVNDGHSAGDYGLPPFLYARFLEARWCELINAKPKPYGTWQP